MEVKGTFLRMKKNYYNPVRVGNFWSNNYNKYETNSNKNKTLSVEEYLEKILPYLKDVVNNLNKFDTRKVELIIVINFIYSKNNDEEPIIHSKGFL